MENLVEKNLISLKEASSISGYSADYIGQLIRAGKIPGKQVYCNVQWMTTAEAVLLYKKKGKNQKDSAMSKKWRQIMMELSIIKLFFQTFKYALPIILVIIISFVLLASFLFATIGGSEIVNTSIQESGNQELTF